MYRVVQYTAPETVDDCARLFFEKKRSRFVAGNLFLRMANITIPLAIDLSRCGLSYIRTDESGDIHIGAMTTLRDVESSVLLQQYANGILSRSAGEIVGVQFRNLATIGASVYSQYGFSDIITPLLACNATVHLYKQGQLSLNTFLTQKKQRDFLTEIILPNMDAHGCYRDFRNASGDFSILNVACTKANHHYTIAVGARPGCARMAERAMELLNSGETDVEKISKVAAETLHFGSNFRASAEYRRALCQQLLMDMLSELTGGTVCAM